MSIHCVRQRLTWIGEHIPASLTSDFEKVFQTLWKDWKKTEIPDLSHSDAIFIHLIYAIFRHRSWCRAEIFPAILVEAIGKQYQCDRTFIRSLVYHFIDLIDGEKRLEVKSDKEFLLYVLIQATSRGDDSQIADEIGLGQEILVKLKGAADSVGRPEAVEGQYVFLPEIDDTFCQILKELSFELKNGSWVLDCYRLKFHLQDLPATWKAIIGEIGAEWLLRILTQAGKSGGTSEEDWVALATEKIGMLLFENGQEKVRDLLGFLEAKQIIYAILDDGRGRKKSKKWHLTSLGEEFTANMFAGECLAAGEVTEELLLRLNGQWQVALIKRVPKKSLGTVLKILSSTRPLNSESYFPAVMKLKDIVDHSTLSQILEVRIRCGGTAGVRAAACRATVVLKASPRLCELLREISVSDPSFLVKESAVNAIDKQRRISEISS
jgi:hypothetical protein